MFTPQQKTEEEKQLAYQHMSMNIEDHTKQDSSKLIDRIPIEGTPWTLIVIPEKVFITMGPYRISPEFKNEEEATKWAEQNQINLIATMIGIVAERLYDDRKQNEQADTENKINQLHDRQNGQEIRKGL